MLAAAQNTQQGQSQQMKGTICNSACVVQQANASTCDPNCTEKSGSTVFVSDSGTVHKIANQDMASPHTGKHVTMKYTPTEEQREESLRITELYEEGP
jgi:CCR4-NOT transcriptional regulation complex NOT5 subunit